MADYTTSKAGGGATYPLQVIEGCWGHVEPMITPTQLRIRHLFGIPLVSNMVDPITGQRQVMTDPILQDMINRAVSMAETEAHLDITPKQRKEKQAFDRQAYQSLGFVMLESRPVVSIERFTVNGSNQQDLFVVPPDWVETNYLHRGQLNIVPMTISFGNAGFISPTENSGGFSGGSVFLSVLGQNPWIPAYWQFIYTTGFPEGKIPLIVNELIGVIAAIEVLSMLASTNAKNTSQSLGIDGLSQGVSTPGPSIYDNRIELLMNKKESLVRKIRSMYGTTMFTGHI